MDHIIDNIVYFNVTSHCGISRVIISDVEISVISHFEISKVMIWIIL
jgi:hypothetical protein